MYRFLYEDGNYYTKKEACQKFGIASRTLDRYLKTMDFTEAVKASLKQRHGDYNDVTNGKSCSAIEKEEGLVEHSLSKYLRTHEGTSLEEAIAYLKRKDKQAWTHFRPDQKELVLDNGEKVKVSLIEYAKTLGCSKMTLYNYLKKGLSLAEATVQIQAKVKDKYTSRPTLWVDEKTTLYQYCLNHGYNYNSIYSRIAEGLSLTEAISAYEKEGQSRPLHWKYEYQGILLVSFLKRYNINSSYIIEWLNKGKTLEETLEIFFFHAPKGANKTMYRQFFDLYNLLETYPEEERFSILMESPLDQTQKDMFCERYNQLAIVKRDLHLLELYRLSEEISLNEKDEFFKENMFTPFEHQYVEENILKPLCLATVHQNQELTKRSVLYYNKPSKGMEKVK